MASLTGSSAMDALATLSVTFKESSKDLEKAKDAVSVQAVKIKILKNALKADNLQLASDAAQLKEVKLEIEKAGQSLAESKGRFQALETEGKKKSKQLSDLSFLAEMEVGKIDKAMQKEQHNINVLLRWVNCV